MIEKTMFREHLTREHANDMPDAVMRWENVQELLVMVSEFDVSDQVCVFDFYMFKYFSIN